MLPAITSPDAAFHGVLMNLDAEWTTSYRVLVLCRNICMSSVQYGLKLPKDGVFSFADRDTLAAEAERLEAL